MSLYYEPLVYQTTALNISPSKKLIYEVKLYQLSYYLFHFYLEQFFHHIFCFILFSKISYFIYLKALKHFLSMTHFEGHFSTEQANSVVKTHFRWK
jgi:hypothetical protein